MYYLEFDGFSSIFEKGCDNLVCCYNDGCMCTSGIGCMFHAVDFLNSNSGIKDSTDNNFDNFM